MESDHGQLRRSRPRDVHGLGVRRAVCCSGPERGGSSTATVGAAPLVTAAVDRSSGGDPGPGPGDTANRRAADRRTADRRTAADHRTDDGNSTRSHALGRAANRRTADAG